MTNEEANYKYDRAIDLIKRIKTEETHEREIDRHKAFDLAISALEKQIPKKPIYEDIGNIYGALKRTCVNCGDVQCNEAHDCITLPMWKKLDIVIDSYLESVTIEDLINGKVE